jgi:glycerophosphoryl diester phosphodiesterase
MIDTHPVLLSEPGKHAFAPVPGWFLERRNDFKKSETRDLAGVSGVLPSEYLAGKVKFSPLNQRLVHTYLANFAFEPSWDFCKEFRFSQEKFVSWRALLDWIPKRVNSWVEKLNQETSPSQYRFLRIGHRGASAYRPDNSLSGFRYAASLGADMVELDVQRTRDGQAAVIHDLYLRADGDRILPVKDSTLAELRKVDLGGGERVPTLKEAIEVCKDENLGAYIEIKDGSAIPLVIQTLRDLEYGGYCFIGSFRPDWLLEVKRAEPRLATSILFGSSAYDGQKSVQLARSCSANFVHPCWESHPKPYELLSPKWMGEVRSAGLGVLLWHEERPEVISELRKAGVDGICSDRPELLK